MTEKFATATEDSIGTGKITNKTAKTTTTTTTTVPTNKLLRTNGNIKYNNNKDITDSNNIVNELASTKTTMLPIPLARNCDANCISSGDGNVNANHTITNNKTKKSTIQQQQEAGSDTEEGFLSTSPDSANGETILQQQQQQQQHQHQQQSANMKSPTDADNMLLLQLPPPICLCTNPQKCVTLKTILDSFKAALSEEQAWALIFQVVSLYRNIIAANMKHKFNALEVPDTLENLSLHNDGRAHCSWSTNELKRREAKIRAAQTEQRQIKTTALEQGTSLLSKNQNSEDSSLLAISHKEILRKIAIIVYSALDYNLPADEQCQMSQELEELITIMTADENEDDCIECSDCIDEGVQEVYKHFDDEHFDDEQTCETKEFDFVLETCRKHVKPANPEDHYKAVCRALVTETIELRVFLQQVLHDGADNLHMKADSQTSKQDLAKLGFNDWARFWVQVIDELRRGVRLKKRNYERVQTEYELTPYEILMEDIRSKNYQLKKVMINGDIPPRVKKDAHAMILEFIRSRPPLKKASERKLAPPLERAPSPREQLMDSIRRGQTLKHIALPTVPRLKDRLLPPAQQTTTATTTTSTTMSSTSTLPTISSSTLDSLKLPENMESPHKTQRSTQRLIKVNFKMLQDDDSSFLNESNASTSSCASTAQIGVCSQPKMPPYPISYMIRGDGCGNSGVQMSTAAAAAAAAASGGKPMTRNMRRITYDLATQCESRRASLRRHTIVGCQSNNFVDEAQSMPTSRPESRQSDVNANAACVIDTDDVSATKQLHNKYNKQQQQQQQQKRSQSPRRSGYEEFCGSESSTTRCRSSSSVGAPWNKSFLDEKTWNERGDDRLSLTLEEIVHIRSVMTKAELEGLPVGVRVKEDVEKRKVCFLCLRTRFSIFGPWGIQCKLCQRTVCSKCYTKMRIPSEHFRNVPLVLISPSLLSSPAGSSTPSPSHHANHAHSSSTGNIVDDTFPKSLIERLLRSESERKNRNSVGSAPSSPKHQRSNTCSPATLATGQTVEALHENPTMTGSYTTGCAVSYTSSNNLTHAYALNKENSAIANSRHFSIMSRSMEGPRSLPVHSPARPYSNSSTLDRRSRFPRAFTLSSSQLSQEQKENMRGELVPVCNDCKGLVEEITRSSKQTRSSARNRALKNLTLDLSPVYK